MRFSWRYLLVIPGLYLAFAILPPLFANNFVFRDHVARKISKACGCRADVVDLKLSSWTGRFKVDIPALDLYEAKSDGKAVMCLDYIHFEMWPHQIFSPFFGMEKGSVRTMEWVRARERVKTFLSAVPYLNVSELQFWEDESRPAYFQRIRFDAKKKNGCLNFNVSCDVDCPALSESALTTRGRYDRSSKTLFLDSLSFTGHKRSAAKTILDGRIVEDVSDVPFTLDCDCIIDREKVELNGISFMADRFLSTGSILKTRDGLTFLLNGSGNFTKELAQLCGLQHRVSHFDSLDCRLEGNPNESGKLLTRTEEQIAATLEDYIVFELDGGVHACAALHFYEDGQAEIAAVAVDENYAHMGIGPKMIDTLIEQAGEGGAESIFIMTTQTADWFEKLGFEEDKIDSIPEERKKLWDSRRGSKVYRLKR